MIDKSIDYGSDDANEDPYSSAEVETPLVAAVLSGDANAVRNLIDRGVNVNKFDGCIEGWAIGVSIDPLPNLLVMLSQTWQNRNVEQDVLDLIDEP